MMEIPKATKTCIYCAEQIQTAATICKHCGRSQKRKASTSNTVISVLALLLFFGMIGFVGCVVMFS